MGFLDYCKRCGKELARGRDTYCFDGVKHGSDRDVLLAAQQCHDEDPELWVKAFNFLKKEAFLPELGRERDKAIIEMFEKMKQKQGQMK